MVLKLVDSKKTGKKTLAFIEAAFNKYQLHCLNVVRKSSRSTTRSAGLLSRLRRHRLQTCRSSLIRWVEGT